ncbi:hypothetical protein ACOMHN_056532 [Nucella lapillus]
MPSAVLLVVIHCALLSICGGLSDVVEDSVGFCNEKASEELLTECTWPCSNVSSCPEGAEFVSLQDCEVPAWKKALCERSLNVTSEDEGDGGNGTLSSEEDLEGAENALDGIQNATACRSVCSKTIAVPKCCAGYFGSQCLECPRSAFGQEDVCSGHGDCNDGIEGDGICHCHDNFTGVACQLCRHSKTFGPNCTEECLCVNGDCNNGPTGDGTCRLCFAGYEGPLCDQEIITCDDLTCAAHSRCEEVLGEAQCVCDPGYEGQPNNVTACTPVNICEKNASRVCGERLCVNTGPGRFRCRCPDGHRDDGVTCHPINPCNDDDGGCDVETTVCVHTGANTSACDCLAYYENYVEGEGCSLLDVCPTARCHDHANCSTIGPNEYRCTCLPGYIGDGKTNCFGNILDRLEEVNRDHPYLRNQLSMAIALLDRIYHQALTQRGPFTIFVPNNRAFRKARRDFAFGEMLRMPLKSQEMIRQHMLAGSRTMEDLQNYDYYYTLQGNTAELQVKVAKGVFKYKVRGYAAKAKVIARDLPAFNGMIHIVNELLINDPQIESNTTKTAMDLIRQEGRFNRLQTLISSLGLESAFMQDNITVFAPENGGLDSLPEGTVDYLTTDEDGKAKLRTLLENHIFPGRIPVTDLISVNRIRSVANYSFQVDVGDRGRVQLLKGKVNVSQADIACKNAVYYHVDGPLIPDQLADILPSRCDIVKNTKIQGEVSEGCKYWGKMQGKWTELLGCKPMCLRTYRIPKCCPGFYGQDCRPCPGGHKNPCGGHGTCSDEMFGSGICKCDRNFRGERCDTCLSRSKYGPNCTEPLWGDHGEFPEPCVMIMGNFQSPVG